MDTKLITSDTAALLSHITEQNLSKQSITPPVLFLVNLVTVLLGVILSDSQVTDEEKQRLQTTLNKFIPPVGDVRRLTQLMIKGVRGNKIYAKSQEIQTLTAPLSEAERLLLISFGYEMSAADGAMDAREKKYLEAVANKLGINPNYLAVLEAGFSHQGTVNPITLDEVRFLLDPAQFQTLDTMFVKAASDMLAVLPTQPKHQKAQQQLASSYLHLKEFQKYRQHLENSCYQIYQVIQDCTNRSILPNNLTEEIKKISNKLQSQTFRLAVIGEFSQGKSTLLNALLGEEIQPTRAIPCSGTVTILKYGSRKRVVCRYKDKREEEIPLHEYQVKAAISDEVALGSLRDEFILSEVKDIVFEHPDLDLCRSGVEIVDSPGLNEHPQRTEITQQLLEKTDAAIFLVNASRPLTLGERDLLKDVKAQLNGGKANEPAENLFVVVNFMDLLRKEKDRQQVRQLVENFLQGQAPLIKGENRIHFISAQAALDAILEGTEDDYLQCFQNFTQSIEKFLAFERGALEIRQSISSINRLIQETLEGLDQAEEVLDRKINISEAKKQEILEQIGEASGRDLRIRLLANKLIEQVIEQANGSWNEWLEGLAERMADKSESWSSQHSPVWSQNQLIKDYINQFTRDLSREIDDWGNTKLSQAILKDSLEILDANIYVELQAIQAEFKSLDQQVKTNFSDQLNLAISGISDDFTGAGGVMGGIGAGGALAAALIFFTPLGWVSLILASLATAVASSFGLGMLDFDGLKDQIKLKVFEVGFQNFDDSMDKVCEKLDEIISSVFDHRVESASGIIEHAISLYEHLLEQQEKAHNETLEERQMEKAFIAQKRQELQLVQKQMEAILPS